jgi:glucokinase
MSTKGFATVADYIEELTNQLRPLIDKVGKHNIAAAGVGAPNANFYTGEIAHAANLDWKGVIPMARLLNEALHLKVTITNDANAAAIGEMEYGAAKGMKDFVMITLGTGVGSGVVAVRDGRPCGCGRSGCLERYSSATGIKITAEEWLADRTDDSLLRQHAGNISAKHIHEAAIAGDALALEIFDYTARILGQTLADLVAITSPEAFVFFGGLAKSGDILLKPTRKYMEANLLQVFKNKVKLLQSDLPDADAAILGASALVW